MNNKDYKAQYQIGPKCMETGINAPVRNINVMKRAILQIWEPNSIGNFGWWIWESAKNGKMDSQVITKFILLCSKTTFAVNLKDFPPKKYRWSANEIKGVIPSPSMRSVRNRKHFVDSGLKFGPHFLLLISSNLGTGQAWWKLLRRKWRIILKEHEPSFNPFFIQTYLQHASGMIAMKIWMMGIQLYRAYQLSYRALYKDAFKL